jgi:hypothetical protein
VLAGSVHTFVGLGGKLTISQGRQLLGCQVLLAAGHHVARRVLPAEASGSVTELTAENADKAVVMTNENGSYTASSDEIAAKYLDKTLYVAAVYESNGVSYCSGVLPYSIAAYCQKPPAGVQDLATAAAIYGSTAKAFFGV